MYFSAPAAATLSALLFTRFASAQTYSNCNPTQQSCPADPALGGSTHTDFTSGASSDYSGTGNGISYNSAGAQLTVSKSGDNPTLTSKWYLMFGRVDFVMKTAPGVGMVSSAILISDDLDEIDWELLGADSTQAQTNYFSKGVTGSFNRGGFASIPTSQSQFNTYSIDWTAEQITWEINGTPVRTLSYSEAAGQYPQTPMQVKVGSWAGGDSSNPQGTIQWAGGPINYAAGPFPMQVQSVSAVDYSTGTQYQYDGTSGSWQSITAVGGSVNGASSGSTPSPIVSSGPSSVWSGTHQATSVYVTPSSWPWVSTPTAQASDPAGPPASSYLASLGYDVSSAHSTTYTPASSTPSSAPLSSPHSISGGCDGVACTKPALVPAATTLATLSGSSMPYGTARTTYASGFVQGTASAMPFNPNAAGREATNVCILVIACLATILAVIL